MSDQASTPTSPGWYPDPRSPGSARYWDGTVWGPAASAPSYQAPPPLRAPEGTDPNTVWIWILALLPLLQVIPLLFMPWQDLFGSMFGSDLTDPSTVLDAELAFFTSPAYLATIALSFVTYAGAIVLALLDYRVLVARGVPKPFHWALTFIPSYGALVYIIGRSVVVRSRTGRGLGPLWVTIGVFVLSLVIGFVVSYQMLSSMSGLFDMLPQR